MNHKKFSVSLRRLAVATAFGGLSLVPVAAQACAAEPMISAVCILATPRTDIYGFAPANGATVQIQSNAALYSLLGTTYGGNGSTTFNLPDLRGRTVIGATMPGGPAISIQTFNVGGSGGANAVFLKTTDVPQIPHTHGATGLTTTVGIGSLAATTTLTGLTASTSMSGVTGTVNGNSFTFNASNTGTKTNNPSGASLTMPGNASIAIYSDAAPSVALKSNSITGSASVAFSGNPTTTVSGAPTTTLSGVPTVSVAGTTAPSTAVLPTTQVSIMQPYLSMNYLIATQGIYPQFQ